MPDEHYTKRIEKLLHHFTERMEKTMALKLDELTTAVNDAVAKLGSGPDAALKAENDQLKADAVKDQATIDEQAAKLAAATNPPPVA